MRSRGEPQIAVKARLSWLRPTKKKRLEQQDGAPHGFATKKRQVEEESWRFRNIWVRGWALRQLVRLAGGC